MTAIHEPETEPSPSSPSRRSAVRLALHTLSSVLIVAGVLLLIDAGLTVTWQEPVSALYAKVQQSKLDGQLDDSFSDVIATPAEKKVLAALPDDSRRIAFAARAYNRHAKPGQAVGKIRIPKIGLTRVIVEGTGTGDLRQGPGHYPATPMPGAPGTVGIAGHRTTYGAPFRNVDKLRPGDPIVVDMPYGTFTYKVDRTRIVPPTATYVTRKVGHEQLVLSACHPLYSAAKRIIIFAHLSRSVPK
jgi:sortase A